MPLGLSSNGAEKFAASNHPGLQSSSLNLKEYVIMPQMTRQPSFRGKRPLPQQTLGRHDRIRINDKIVSSVPLASPTLFWKYIWVCACALVHIP